MNKIRFEKSIGWEKGYKLAVEIYKLTRKFPREEIYCLTAQMRRCAMSIPLNISEGLSRNSKKELSQFFIISRGSCGELLTILMLSKDLEYIKEGQFNELIEKTEEIVKILTSSIKTLKGLK